MNRGITSGPTPGNGQADQSRQAAEYRRYGQDHKRQPQPQPAPGGKPVERKRDRAPEAAA